MDHQSVPPSKYLEERRKTYDLSWNWSPLYGSNGTSPNTACSIVQLGRAAKQKLMMDRHAVSLPESNRDRSVNNPLQAKDAVKLIKETIPAGAVLPVTLMATVHSPRALRRRRREIELEARRLATADFSSSDSSPPRESSDDARPAPMLLRTKALSASPSQQHQHQTEDQRRDRRKQRRSYRQYIRDKRSRSREKARAASADRHRFVDDQSLDGSSLSQVHWKVHKMPQGMSATSESLQDLPDASQQRLDKAQQRLSWINKSLAESAAPSNKQVRNNSIPTSVTLVGRYEPPSSSSQPSNQMAILSQSIHGSLTRNNQSNSASQLHSQTMELLPFVDALAGGQQRKTDSTPALTQTAPRGAAPLQQQQQQQHQQQHQQQQQQHQSRSSQESSPLDTIPVKETPTTRRSVLKISENSAFRPIQPADVTPPPPAIVSAAAPVSVLPTASPYQSAQVVVLPSARLSRSQAQKAPAANAPKEEPIYVSVKDVTRHVPDQTPSRLKTSSVAESAPMSTSRVLPAKNKRPPAVSTQAKSYEEQSRTMEISPGVSSGYSGQSGAPKSSLVKSRSTVVAKPQVGSAAIENARDSYVPTTPATDSTTTSQAQPYVARPPPQDESNLERWRARKRSMETSRKDLTVPDRKPADNRVPLLRSRTSENLSHPSSNVSPSAFQPSPRATIVSDASLPSSTPAQSTGVRPGPITQDPNASNRDSHSQQKPKISFRRQIALEESPEPIQKRTDASPLRAQQQEEPGSDKSAPRSWFVTPSRLNASASAEGVAAAAWKQRDLVSVSPRPPIAPPEFVSAGSVLHSADSLQSADSSRAPTYMMGAHNGKLDLHKPTDGRQLAGEVAYYDYPAHSMSDNVQVLSMLPMQPSPATPERRPGDSLTAMSNSTSPSLALLSSQNVSNKAQLFERRAQQEELDRMRSFGVHYQSLGTPTAVRRHPSAVNQRAKTIQIGDYHPVAFSSPEAARKYHNAPQHRQEDINANYFHAGAQPLPQHAVIARGPADSPQQLPTDSDTSVGGGSASSRRLQRFGGQAQRATIGVVQPEPAGLESRVAEKTRLFEARTTDKPLERRTWRRRVGGPDAARFQTQPVTQEELAAASINFKRSVVEGGSSGGGGSGGGSARGPNDSAGSYRRSPSKEAVSASSTPAVKRSLLHPTARGLPVELTESSDESLSRQSQYNSGAATEVQRRREARLKRRGAGVHESFESISGPTRIGGGGEATLGIYQVAAAPRSVTQPIFIKPPAPIMATDMQTSPSIAARLTALQKNGSDEWKQRVKKDEMLPVILRQKNNVETPESRNSIVKERMSKLIDSSGQWQNRVADKDTEELTVNGKLERAGLIVKLTATPTNRRTNDKIVGVSDEDRSAKRLSPPPKKATVTKTDVAVPKSLDEGFSEFYPTPMQTDDYVAPIDTAARMWQFQKASTKASANSIRRLCKQMTILGVAKNVRPPRRQTKASRNPVKALAERNEVQDSYTDTQSAVNVALRRAKADAPTVTPQRPLTMISLNAITTPGNRGSQLADEAIRALSQKEDFSNVRLKRPDLAKTPGQAVEMKPHNDLMLIQVRGRKFVDLRLVKPAFDSLHGCACFILVNSENVFLFDGRFSGVLEKAKAREIAGFIVETHDLGCRNASRVVELDEEVLRATNDNRSPFWNLIGQGKPRSVQEVRVPADLDEEDRFEDIVCAMTKVYEVNPSGALTLRSEFSGQQLRHSILQSDKVLVFDFGVEVYVWCGRNASLELKKTAQDLAREHFSKPFGGVAPSRIFGSDFAMAGERRPEWCLVGEVKERMETCLFRAKFIDWPEVAALRSVMIKASTMQATPLGEPIDPAAAKRKKMILALKDPSTIEMTPEVLGIDLVDRHRKEPDLVLEDTSLGRGREVTVHGDSSRFEVFTEETKMWRVVTDGQQPVEVVGNSFGQFFSEECFVIRWQYRVSYDAKAMGGGESKHKNETGRSRAVYFYWIGADSPRSLQGACALAVRDLDTERHPHVRVSQGLEPPAFLNLFKGHMVAHNGRQLNSTNTSQRLEVRLFAVLGGPFPSEACLCQVDANAGRSLRSQGAFLFVCSSPASITVWAGSLCSSKLRETAQKLGAHLAEQLPPEFNFAAKPSVRLCLEGQDPGNLFPKDVTIPRPLDFDNRDTIRLMRITTSGGNQFGAVEAVSSWYSAKMPAAFPYEQDDLYGASQPATFLIDQTSRLWVWEGYIDGDDQDEAVMHKMRLQRDEAVMHKMRLQRVFALKLAASYWKARHEDSDKKPSKVVFAGLEPTEFKALFPVWVDQEEAALWSKKNGRKEGEALDLGSMLEELTLSTYPVERLRRKPLPEGVDGSKLESYLSDPDFERFFGMSKAIFYDLPQWKQLRLKKELNFF
uniref:HP domain-containing protein n=1 Tax=Plectus sambesii TaxID=2011161 RepID=A0A914XAF0_9BILA